MMLTSFLPKTITVIIESASSSVASTGNVEVTTGASTAANSGDLNILTGTLSSLQDIFSSKSLNALCKRKAMVLLLVALLPLQSGAVAAGPGRPFLLQEVMRLQVR